MSDIAIRVENLGKLYRLGPRERYKTLRATLSDGMSAPFRAIRNLRSSVDRQPSNDFIWALKDISFEIKQGEVIGFIGRNGAGKSTLLKILSRITEPTEGFAEVRGRVGSLLEVGTGFHPELTGRENIYLNGAILGMKKAEIALKFDEIVAFAEIEKFLDTPVKHYSSGMYVRLAFAVAAHMEPEILLVDEVLAVGDAAFQKKCLGKMGTVAQEGRTVLFVSHSMAAISGLCSKGIVIEKGFMVFDGHTDSAINHYIGSISRYSVQTSLESRTDRKGCGKLRFTNVRFLDSRQDEKGIFLTGETLIVEITYIGTPPLSNVSISVPFFTHMGQPLFMGWTRMVDSDFESLPPQGRIYLKIPKLPLREGNYSINLYCEVNGILADWVQEAIMLNVIDGDFFGTGKTPPPSHGVIVVEHEFYHES